MFLAYLVHVAGMGAARVVTVCVDEGLGVGLAAAEVACVGEASGEAASGAGFTTASAGLPVELDEAHPVRDARAVPVHSTAAPVSSAARRGARRRGDSTCEP